MSSIVVWFLIIVAASVIYAFVNEPMIVVGFLFVAALPFLLFSSFQDIKANETNELRERQLGFARKDVKFVVRSPSVKGYKVGREFKWIRTEREFQSEAEEDLRLQAYLLGANAVVRLNYTIVRERVIAGYGHKGNPYYKTESTKVWEGLAVRLERVTRPTG